MSNSLRKFLGGNLKPIIIKLFIFSFLVGILLKAIGYTPLDLIKTITKLSKSLLEYLWETGFATFTNFFHVIMTGALIVVPIFLFLCILNKK
ncbi:hypothetical protein ABID23_001289 [Bartonella silvatica]|uniref:DUF6460 domain-containing protein n=1 Tax=Bartonella silvatica TaxID=357760 RepID=A0ABV2HI07_9HYPH